MLNISIAFNSGMLACRANVLRGLFRSLRRCLCLLPNPLMCFVHCNGSRFLGFHVRVRSGGHKSSYLKKVQRLLPNPNQLASSNGKAESIDHSHGASCDSFYDDSCNFLDLFSESIYVNVE